MAEIGVLKPFPNVNYRYNLITELFKQGLNERLVLLIFDSKRFPVGRKKRHGGGCWNNPDWSKKCGIIVGLLRHIFPDCDKAWTRHSVQTNFLKLQQAH